ncbi:cytochrome P450 [Amycolatopsis sp. cmx-4-68]|uniref:cytochrome P450 n=1 Tax=Amycolatopsis sp. cmx-4-68 TaxID=2790938 RepID=UPI00397E405F
MNTYSPATLFAEILKLENQPSPHALWAELRKQPVFRQDDGTWVVTSYHAVKALMADPRLSSDKTKAGPDATMRASAAQAEGQFVGFIDMDPPDHARTRRAVMAHFGPPAEPRKVLNLEAEITRLATNALDKSSSRTRMDVVDDYAYPVPLNIIMSLLGIPAEDAPRVKEWFQIITNGELAQPDISPEALQEFGVTVGEALQYMTALAQWRRSEAGNDLISGLANEPNRMPDVHIAGTGLLLLGAGHETTVNATSSAILTLLRNPEQLQLLVDRPELVPSAFEEVLRLEPPIAFRDRHTLAEITAEGVTIPKGVTVQLSLAAANRDPARFSDPDRFDPQRPDNQHLSFWGGPHFCFGAPLARLEGRLLISEWIRRVQEPRLVDDPPPYRKSFGLRGPRHLLVDYDHITR